jgi:crotonobetainyl-CoA:carnitine CoA-transferase CaiB-like acyl-CoA transferase
VSPPLEGIRVVSMAEQYPGPYCTLLLADMGADVITVERPGVGDPSRGPGGMSDFFAALNRNKRSVTANLRSEGGRQVVHRLIEAADVFVEGFRPGVCDRLGVGYQALRELNPRLVYASLSGFGQSGPYRERPAHDLSYQAMAGLLAGLIPSGCFDNLPAVAIGDLSSGMFTALGILAALLARQRTGRGQYLDVSMTDGLLSWMTVALSGQMWRGSGAEVVPIGPAYGVYQCADGKYVSLSIVLEDHFWRNLCGAIGREDLAALNVLERWQRREDLAEVLAEAMRTRPRDEWVEALAQADVASGPVYDLSEVLEDPQFRERGMFVDFEGRGGQTTRLVNHPLRFSETPAEIRRLAPTLSEHTEEVLSELGYSADEIAALHQAGAI